MAERVNDAVPHPWNTAFTWRSPVGPFQILDDDQAAHFDEHGFVVLENVFSEAVVDELIAEIDEYEAEVDGFLKQLDGGRISIAETGAITFAANLVTRSPSLAAFSAHPVFAQLCHDLVGPDANLYWDQAVYKKPDKPRRFPWHQDNGYTFIEPQQYLTCWVALTDATVDNGCPHVVPGAHRLGTITHEYIEPLGWECFSDPAHSVAAPVGAGGIVVFSSLTPHLTGPNITPDVRKSYILQYSPPTAEILEGDPTAGPPTNRTACDDPGRQFPVVHGGVATGPPVGSS